MSPLFLTPAQVEQFIETGYLVMKQGFPKEVAHAWADTAFARLGYDRHDPSTWAEKRIHMPGTRSVDCAEFAPKVWAAVCDLLGGEERIHRPYKWSDHFICNLGVGADRPWEPPSPTVGGWHKDGDFFRHFLDSPEQGLLTIVCWTDMVHTGGGTFIAPDSVGVVARFLADHPEGVLPGQFPTKDLMARCRQFVELTGEAGDVVLHHPYMLHATSQNVLRVERVITNPPVHLREPMRFDRDDPAEFSPVERAVLRGLGVDRLDFRPTHERERIVPERVKRQQQMLEQEKARAGAKAG